MTRPTSFREPFPQGVGGTGGDPALPPGQSTSDCCTPDEDMPDRAEGGNTFIGTVGGDGSLVQSDDAEFGSGAPTLAYPSDTTAGNLLVATMVTRGGSVVPTLAGWNVVGGGGINNPSEARMWWRVAPGGPVTVTPSTVDTVMRLCVMEFDGGAAGLLDSDSLTAQGPSASYDLPDLTVTTSALMVGLVTAQGDNPNPITFTDDTGWDDVYNGRMSGNSLGPSHIVSRDVVAAGTHDYNPTGNHSVMWGGVLAAFDLGEGWVGGGYLSVDGDDTTCTRIEGPNVLEEDLGEAFAIGRLRMVIGCETAGARSYLLEGANEADFSDAVSVVTIDFTATGSFTSQTVIETWTPPDSYRFWRLTGDDEVRDLCTFTLQEPGSADAGAVQAALDAHIDEILTHHTAETDDTLVLAPDGAGGVEWRAESAGSSIYYNVLDYGAVGDNSTDDTSAIQDAVDAADAAGGGTIFFPNGGRIYKITATIVNAGPVMYLGEGGAGLDNAGPQVHMTTANTTAFRSNGDPAYSTGFQNLVIVGPGGASSGAGIYGNNRNIFTYQVRVQGFYNGIRIGPSSFYSKLWQTFVLSNANADILLEAGANNVELHACRLDSAVYGIRAEGVHGLRMFGGSIEGNTYGVYGTTGNQAVHLSGVYFESNTTSDIYFGVTGADKSILIEGCLFTTLGTTRSVDANNVDRLTIIGCFWDAANPPSLDIRTQSATTYVQLGNNVYSGAGTTFTGPVRDLDPSQSVTPNAIGTAAAGTSRYYANAAHVHATGAGTPSTQAIGDSASTGSGPAAAMTDHKHAMPAFGSPVAVGAANADGSAATIARSDHVHEGATTSGIGGLAIDSVHSTPLVFGDILQESDGSDFLYTSP